MSGPAMDEWYRKLIVVDTETGGLDPDRHPIWQVAWATWGTTHGWEVQSRLLHHDRDAIDPWVKENTSYERRFSGLAEHPYKPVPLFHPVDAMRAFAAAARGKHIVGMVPSFDEERLRRLSQRHGVDPTWHYHLVDIETLIVGLLMARGVEVPLPWKSDDLCRAIGVDPDPLTRHDAEGDVELNIACLEALAVDNAREAAS